MIYVSHSMFLERLHPFPDLVNGRSAQWHSILPELASSTVPLALMKCHS